MKQIKANKTQLRKNLEWSTSRFNDFKKDEAIELILIDIKRGKNVKRIFSVGSFSTSSHLGSFRYEFEIKNGKSTIIKKTENKILDIFELI